MTDTVLVRDATPDDFLRINEIYNWTIFDNHVSFDIEPWDLERRTAWWQSRPEELDVLVAELDGLVVGITYSSFYRPKVAYRSTAETTIVLDTAYLGRGLGTTLLSAMLDRLKERRFHRAVAIIALPNDASVILHQKL
ncbi:MAG: N-acetyltransferase, partial [bacterium]|nr:N-acetyltransferase [bacterium]